MDAVSIKKIKNAPMKFLHASGYDDDTFCTFGKIAINKITKNNFKTSYFCKVYGKCMFLFKHRINYNLRKLVNGYGYQALEINPAKERFD